MRRNLDLSLVLAAAAVLFSCSGGVTDPAPDGTRFIFRNAGTLPVTSAGASTCDDMSEWPNQLKSALAPGAQVTIDVYAQCWNLQAVFSDGREVIKWDVKMTKGSSYTWPIS